MNGKLIALFFALGLLACQSKKDKLTKEIIALENSDSSSTPKGFNQLADKYYEYAKDFTKDSTAEKYLYKGFMFKYITGHWDDALKFANFYKATYPKSENYYRINLKLADLYNTGKNNPDSAVYYYVLSDGKVEFSTDENRKAGSTLEKWVKGRPGNEKNPALLYSAAKFYQLSGDFVPAISLYAEVANTYPGFEKSPDALMAAGFISWNDLKDTEKAKSFYKQLSEKYPDHPLAKEARMILSENILTMSDLELSEYLMKKNKEQ